MVKRLTAQEAVALMEVKSGLPGYLIKVVMATYGFIARETLKHGMAIDVPGLGSFVLKEVKSRGERFGMSSPYSNTFKILPPTQPYNKPYCVFSKEFRKELKEITLGKPFEGYESIQKNTKEMYDKWEAELIAMGVDYKSITSDVWDVAGGEEQEGEEE